MNCNKCCQQVINKLNVRRILTDEGPFISTSLSDAGGLTSSQAFF